MLIVRPDAPLFYANAELVRDAIEQAAASSPDPSTAWCSSWTETMRSTSPAQRHWRSCEGQTERALGLAHVHATTEEMMRRTGILGKLGAGHIFPNLDTAVTWASTAAGK